MDNSIITLGDLLKKNKKFIIPYYQRGYIWGKSHIDGSDNSVKYIINSIKESYSNKKELFLQGITVTEDKNGITLIDGQQRITFFLFVIKLSWI